MANVRMMPPGKVSSTTTKIHGRTYTCAAGSTLDVIDADARVLAANGWAITASAVGATATRPANPRFGQTFHDTTLGVTVIWEGAAWRDPATGNAV
jgi:hypothetical protein